MLNDNKTCIICGAHYKYCEGCPTKYNVKETWRNLFCSERCRSTYHLYDQIKAGTITSKGASNELKRINASYLSSLKEPMRSVLIGSMNIKNINEESVTEEVSVPVKRGRRKKN